MIRRRLGLAVVAAAVLTACGGGGGGNGFPILPLTPAPAPPSSPAPVKTSADCVNEADFHEGTVLAVRRGPSSLSGPTIRTRIETGAREPFAQANPITFFHSSPDIQNSGREEINKVYRDIVSGKVVDYGSFSNNGITNYLDSVWLNEPPIAMPIAFQEGETVRVDYVLNVDLDGGKSTTRTPTSVSKTYLGRETIQTPVGTFDTCKFLAVTQAEGSSVVKLETWVAAEGPFRGQELKWNNPDDGFSSIVRDMTYEPK